MKALLLVEYNRFQWTDVPEPAVGPEEVLVAVGACGICGSDVHGMDGSTGRRKPPIIMGHEAAGTIVRVGDAVRGWAAGDRVTFDSTIYCGRCVYCAAGRVNLCNHRRVLGVACDEFKQDGALAEFVAVPQNILYRLPEGLSFERAAMVEPVSIAVHAVGRLAPRLGESAVVVGAGMIGLFVVQTLRAAGCGGIFAVDIDPRKLDMARRLGADETFSPEQCDVAAEIARRTGGLGAELAVEAVGLPDTVAAAIAAVRKGGRVALVGNVTPNVDLALQATVTRELSLLGCCASAGEYPACLDLIARGAIDVDALTAAVAPMSEGTAWIARLQRGNEGLLKVVLRP